MADAVDVEYLVEEIGQRFGVLDLPEDLHSLLVLHPFLFEAGEGLGAGALELGGQDRPRPFQRGLDHRDDVQFPFGRGLVQTRDGFQHEQAEGLVEGEVLLEVDGHPHPAPELVGLVQSLEHARRQQRAVHADGLVDMPALGRPGVVVVGQQAFHGAATVPGTVEHLEQHGVGDLEAGRQGFGRRGHETVERALVPVHETLGRLGFYHFAPLGRVVPGAGQGPVVLAHVLGRLGDDAAGGIEAGAARPPRPSGGTPGPTAPGSWCRRILTTR